MICADAGLETEVRELLTIVMLHGATLHKLDTWLRRDTGNDGVVCDQMLPLDRVVDVNVYVAAEALL